jgi:hypothetical protein
MNPDTIVLIHGFWVTPRSWERWKPYYEQQGYRVLTLAYPGFEVEVSPGRAEHPEQWKSICFGASPDTGHVRPSRKTAVGTRLHGRSTGYRADA